MESANTFGRLLLRFRHDKQMTRSSLARLADIDLSYLFRIETGDRTPSRELILTLAEALKLDGETLNQWLAAADYKPLALIGPVRTRGPAMVATETFEGQRKPVRTRGKAADPHAAGHRLLEAMGLSESAAEVAALLERSDSRAREDADTALSIALSRVLAGLKSPVRWAVIPAAGGQQLLLAPHVVQGLLLKIVAEAVVSGVSKFVFVVAPGFQNSLIATIEEALAVSAVPPIEIQVREQPKALGLGDAILCAGDLIASERLVAVCLPDDVLKDRSKRIRPPDLQRMIRAADSLGEGALVAVSEMPRARLLRSGVVLCEKQEIRKGIRKASTLVEKPGPDDPIFKNENWIRGIIGRYILPAGVVTALRKIKGGRGPSARIELTEGLEAFRKSGRNVYAFELDPESRDDVGFILTEAREVIG